MAEKYLKIIQNGTSSYVPNNQANKNFWAKQNSLVSRSQAAHKETVTILEATDDEVAFMQHSNVGASKPSVHQSPTADNSAIFEMMNRLQKQNEEQARRIDDLMAKRNAPIMPDATVTAGGEGSDSSTDKEKSKPGPKPKDK